MWKVPIELFVLWLVVNTYFFPTKLEIKNHQRNLMPCPVARVADWIILIEGLIPRALYLFLCLPLTLLTNEKKNYLNLPKHQAFKYERINDDNSMKPAKKTTHYKAPNLLTFDPGSSDSLISRKLVITELWIVSGSTGF